MSKAQRQKGLRGESEVRHIFEGYGWTVRGLESAGDWLALKDGKVLHVEVKRQEVLRLPLWARQARAECPAGAVPVVAFRPNREPWRVLVPAMVAAIGLWPAVRILVLNGEPWHMLTLDDFLGIIG